MSQTALLSAFCTCSTGLSIPVRPTSLPQSLSQNLNIILGYSFPFTNTPVLLLFPQSSFWHSRQSDPFQWKSAHLSLQLPTSEQNPKSLLWPTSSMWFGPHYVLTLSSSALPLSTIPRQLASLLLLECAKVHSCLRAFALVFLVPGTLFPQKFIWLAPSLPSDLCSKITL